MAAITAQMVKTLREKTGAGMMDCKKALGETEGDIEAAVDWLRKKGLSAAAKKAGRVAAEGVVAVATGNGSGALVEVNSETDFVSRNGDFQSFAGTLASMALETGEDLDALKSKPYPGTDRSVEEQLTHNIATIGENMSIRRAIRLDVEGGVVVPYIHNAVASGIGKIGVLVGLKSTADAATLEALGKQLAMHVAATAPKSLSVEDLDPTEVEREKSILVDQAKASGRPPEIIEKMVTGRLQKFYQEVVLLEQTFVIDNESKVAKVIENAAKDAGTPIEMVGFKRFNLGEGIEREEADF
ncbi:MAG: elongation factor Ts, partial [Alphaproteobacteria bacterium]|nr:elongation factor Ts [Alphaproteobacteria bacterium]